MHAWQWRSVGCLVNQLSWRFVPFISLKLYNHLFNESFVAIISHTVNSLVVLFQCHAVQLVWLFHRSGWYKFLPRNSLYCTFAGSPQNDLAHSSRDKRRSPGSGVTRIASNFPSSLYQLEFCGGRPICQLDEQKLAMELRSASHPSLQTTSKLLLVTRYAQDKIAWCISPYRPPSTYSIIMHA